MEIEEISIVGNEGMIGELEIHVLEIKGLQRADPNNPKYNEELMKTHYLLANSFMKKQLMTEAKGHLIEANREFTKILLSKMNREQQEYIVNGKRQRYTEYNVFEMEESEKMIEYEREKKLMFYRRRMTELEKILAKAGYGIKPAVPECSKEDAREETRYASQR
jgi:hypothetical protein